MIGVHLFEVDKKWNINSGLTIKNVKGTFSQLRDFHEAKEKCIIKYDTMIDK